MSRTDPPRSPEGRFVVHQTDLAKYEALLRLHDQGFSVGAIARELGTSPTSVRAKLRRAEHRLCSGVMVRLDDGSLRWSDEHAAGTDDRAASDVRHQARPTDAIGRQGQPGPETDIIGRMGQTGPVFPPPLAPPPDKYVNLRRAEQALLARKEGLTWDEVGKRLGGSPGTLHRLCRWAMYMALVASSPGTSEGGGPG